MGSGEVFQIETVAGLMFQKEKRLMPNIISIRLAPVVSMAKIVLEGSEPGLSQPTHP